MNVILFGQVLYPLQCLRLVFLGSRVDVSVILSIADDNAKAYRRKAFALFSVSLLNIVHIPQQYSVSYGPWVHWLRLMPLILISAVVYLPPYTRRRRCITGADALDERMA